MHALKVCKFGGTSVANAQQIRKVGEIIKSDPSRKIIVVSAPVGITDMLYRAYEHKDDFFTFGYVFDGIRERFSEIIRLLPSSPDINLFITNFLVGLRAQIVTTPGTSMTKDYFVSRGEYLNAMIIADYLGYTFVDAQDVIFFENGRNTESPNIDWELTNEMVDGIRTTNLKQGMVVPGFYGTLPEYGVKTFSRGGSDVTGAVLAKALNASVYENWTDVQGLHTANPKIVSNARHVREVTYDEMRELAYSGALILHPDALLPMKETGIPINIRNTNAPNDPGTMVVKKKQNPSGPITGIASRSNFAAFSIKKVGMNDERGFIRSITEIFEKQGISVEHTPNGIDRFSIVVPIEEITGQTSRLIKEISNILNVRIADIQNYLEIYVDLSLVTVVGENMTHIPGIAGRIFTACGNDSINIKMLTQDLGEMNVIFGVDANDEHRAVKAVYDEFFNERSNNWMIVILKDGEDTVIPFNNKTEAEEYRSNLLTQGISSYLCKVEKTP